MTVKRLLERLEYEVLQTGGRDNLDFEVTEIIYDSRKVTKDCIFVCIKGANRDSHDFAAEAAEKGAAVIITEREINVPKQAVLIKAGDTRLALAKLSAAYFDYPAEKLITIGVTGTKGKTTTVSMIRAILEKTGVKTGLIGTIEVIINDKVIPANNTTPESYLLQEYFYEMVKAGCRCVVMEVSSQGLMLNRVAGFVFDYGIFTNIEPDHIGPNEHKDFADYLRCKSLLFKRCRCGIVNGDDTHIKDILEGHTCTVETFGMNERLDLYAECVDLHSASGNMGVIYQVKGLLNFKVKVNVPGKFTVYNSLTAIAVCRHFDIPVPIMQQAFLDASVKGRVERVDISKRFTLMIDYAHNAMSLKSLLTTLKEYEPKRLICLFGCGGNRARDRRFHMGEISASLADLTVVTSDNPRTEEPAAIIEDILVGVKRGKGAYVSISDRKEAIRYCILNAKDGDVIVLAGKGHEDYQEINGVKYHMDERELIRDIVLELSEEERSRGGLYPNETNECR